MSDVEIFNKKQYEALDKICKGIAQPDIDFDFYVAYWDKNGEFVIRKPEEENHEWINYYWVEYKNNGEQYRITMFFKDFDYGSGNIHVLPGGIQVWKQIMNCKSSSKLVNGFCEKDLEKCKKDKSGNVVYDMIGGEPYCEYGWTPLLKTVVFWDDKILNELIEAIKYETFNCFKKTLYSNEFYKNVSNYSNKGRRGHYKKYSLFKFDGEKLYYKTIFIENYGYFTKFDGEEVKYNKGNDENGCGPNYYDQDLGRWSIAKEQFSKIL